VQPGGYRTPPAHAGTTLALRSKRPLELDGACSGMHLLIVQQLTNKNQQELWIYFAFGFSYLPVNISHTAQRRR
jgi:hypothetical protein